MVFLITPGWGAQLQALGHNGTSSGPGFAMSEDAQRDYSALIGAYADIGVDIVVAHTFRLDADSARDSGERLDMLIRRVLDATHAHTHGKEVWTSVSPKGDCYNMHEDGKPRAYTQGELERYFDDTISAHAHAGSMHVHIETVPTWEQAVVAARIAQEHALAYTISFYAPDGRLPLDASGRQVPLHDAIERVDRLYGAAGYMINCVSAPEALRALEGMSDPVIRERVIGVYANTSDDPAWAHENALKHHRARPGAEQGTLLREIHERFPHVQYLGSCCGDDVENFASMRDVIMS